MNFPKRLGNSLHSEFLFDSILRKRPWLLVCHAASCSPSTLLGIICLTSLSVAPSLLMGDAPRAANGYQLKDSLQFKCDVGGLAHSLASLHLLRLQWDGWEFNWFDPLDSCYSDAVRH